ARPRGWSLALGALACAAAGALAMLAVRPVPASRPAAPVTFTVDPPKGSHFLNGLDLSPNGQSLAFVAQDASGTSAIWVRDLAAPDARRLAGTEGAHFPFWSPDGRQLGFFAGNELRTIDLVGGAVRSLAPTGPSPDIRGGAWGREGIVYAPSFTGPLLRIDPR